VVAQLKTIVNTQGFDGVDIDYEYFHTAKSSAFLKDLTIQLKNELGADKIVSHAPMGRRHIPGQSLLQPS